MDTDKDIRFTEKKVDQSWKDQVASSKAAAPDASPKVPATSKVFVSLVQSLGIQTLVHLGAMPNPISQQTELNLEAAKETIDVLVALREKTLNNLSSEEKQMMDTLLAELQVKFSQSV
ncbi:MAG: hypothetical protein BWY42_01024 [Candidatus Omnitrophica bacterium ADurb.Bin277]|nr:MAG: hypothetical protein BWY42_01024 [Candidatus Omnitrophica bacterium ADurb.Bin277]